MQTPISRVRGRPDY